MKRKLNICKFEYKGSKMYNHFVCKLSNTRLVDANKKYKKQLDDIDKQHKFIILRTLHGGKYETEMNRSAILKPSSYL